MRLGGASRETRVGPSKSEYSGDVRHGATTTSMVHMVLPRLWGVDCGVGNLRSEPIVLRSGTGGMASSNFCAVLNCRIFFQFEPCPPAATGRGWPWPSDGPPSPSSDGRPLPSSDDVVVTSSCGLEFDRGSSGGDTGGAAEGAAPRNPDVPSACCDPGLQPQDIFFDGWIDGLRRVEGALSLKSSSSTTESSSERCERRLVPAPEGIDLSLGAASSRILSRNEPRIFVDVARNSHVASLE